jgi:ATP/maltotriose-dependent transcriptional regulator MalT
VIKQHVLKAVGPISEDPDLVAAEDYDLWLRCALHTDAFEFSAKQLGYYWHANDSMTQTSRTLRWGAALRRKYPEYDFQWLSYVLARAYYKDGQLDKAYAEMQQAKIQDSPVHKRFRFYIFKYLLMIKMYCRPKS